MNNPLWLKLLISRTNFHGPKDIRVIEVRRYFVSLQFYNYKCVQLWCSTEPEFYGDLVYKFRRIVGNTDFFEQ